jgi:Cu/Ag efflux protein CusF
MLRAVLTLFVAMVLSFGAFAQHASNAKPHTLTGKVTEVSKDKLTVNHEEVKGYMGAMTMAYKVDKPAVLSKLKVGDEIRATVYDADYTLYNIQVVPAKGK